MYRYFAWSLGLLFLLFCYSASAQQNSFQVLGGSASAAGGEVIPIPAEAQTVEQIYQFLDGLGEMEPAGKSEQEVIAHQRKVFRTVKQAVDKALTMEITDEQAVEGHFYRLQALQYLKQLGEAGADDEFNNAIAAAVADTRPQVRDIGMKFHVETGLSMWSMLNDQQRSSLIGTILSFVGQGKPDTNKLQMILTVVDYMGDMPGGAPYAKQLLDATIPLYKSSEDPELAKASTLLEGISRRMALPGNPMQLSGKLLDGSNFNWDAYRGKVVLVDFWASWCGPCLAEVPNVLKMYKGYHEKGFDVVGISLDEKIEQTQATVAKLNVPWATIFDHEEALSNYYGITGIPRAILVDQVGNVVHMMARGPYLEQELRKLLGEPLATTEEPKRDAAVQPASAEEAVDAQSKDQR